MQNFLILCRIWKHVNSAKHWTVISTVLQQVKVQSDQQCKFFGLPTFCVGSWSVKKRSSKTEGVLGACKGNVKYDFLQCKRQFARSGHISEFHIFATVNAVPCTVPPGAHVPFAPFPPPLDLFTADDHKKMQGAFVHIQIYQNSLSRDIAQYFSNTVMNQWSMLD